MSLFGYGGVPRRTVLVTDRGRSQAAMGAMVDTAAEGSDGEAVDDVTSHDSASGDTGTPAADALDSAPITVGARVRCQRTDQPAALGVVVEDYDGYHGVAVHVGDDHIVDAARRWAVALDSGELIFVDSAKLTPATPDVPADDPAPAK